MLPPQIDLSILELEIKEIFFGRVAMRENKMPPGIWDARSLCNATP